MNRNIFTNNQSSSSNIFNNNNTSNSSNNNSSNNNNNSGQSSNIFTRSQANNQNNSSNSQSNNRNIFTQNNSSGYPNNQNGNIFNNQNSSSNNQSNQSNQNNSSSNNNNIFNNNSNNQGGNIFNNSNNQGGNIFNNNQQGNLFSNNNQNGNMFNNNRQGNNIFNNNSNNNNPLNFLDPILGINFANLNADEQTYVFSKLSTEQIRNYIKHHLKKMTEVNKFQNIRLSRENTIKNQKINKLATDFNIKKQILHIKKTIRDNVSVPVKNLKIQHEKVMKQSFELISNLSSSLEKEKRKLIGAIEQQKMLKDIKAQFQEINNQIEDFLRPLYNSHQKGGHFTFVDPDPFCLHISQQILKNITFLDNKMDDLISSQQQSSQGSEFLVNTIEQLLAYFENVAIQFQRFNAKYNELKRRKVHNHEGTLQRINKKATNAVTTEMKSYKLIKEIEEILQNRIQKANE